MKKSTLLIAGALAFVLVVITALLFLRQNNQQSVVKVLVQDDPVIITNVVRLAVEQRGGTINDLEIEIQPLDMETGNITEPDVVGVLGINSSGLAREVIPIANGVNVPVVSHLATWPGLTKPGFAPGEPGVYYPSGQRNFFRTVPSDDSQGFAAALWLGQQDISRVYIFSSDGVYGEGLSGVFESNASDFGLQIIGRNTIALEDLDPDMSVAEATELAALYVEQLLAAEPDALFFPVSGIVHPFPPAYLNAVLTARPDLIVIGGDGLSQIPIPEEMDAVEGIFATDVVPSFAITAAAETFRNDYERAYGEEPPSWTLSLYDGVNAFFTAVERADDTSAAVILDELNNLGVFEGVLGEWNFDENGDINLNSISLRQLQDNEWVFIQVIR